MPEIASSTLAATARARLDGLVRKGLFRSSGLQLLLSLVVLFVSYPFLDGVPHGEAITSALFTYVMLTALLAVGGRPRVLVIGAILLAPAIVFRWLPHFTALAPDHPLSAGSLAIFVAFTIWQLLRFALRARRVDGEVLSAGISVYLLIGLLWAFLYLMVAGMVPHAFAFTPPPPGATPLDFADSIYFSFCTLTTAGYGDITPLNRVVRMLATLESIAGVLYLAVLIARLVSLYSQPAEKP